MEKLDSIPLEIQPFLNELKEIVVNDLPIGLQPLSSISHQMCLMPRSSLQNKAPHKMTPAKNEEVDKQEQELLDRGVIREILSPCVIPAVLTAKKGGEWRMCTDSQTINKITIKYLFLLPRMGDLMDYLSGEKYFFQDKFKEWVSSYSHQGRR